MEREVELSDGSKVLVKNPGLNGEMIIWDFITACEPLLDQFNEKFAGKPMNDTRMFFAITSLLSENWEDMSGLVVRVVSELTGKPGEDVRTQMNLADKVQVLKAGWDVMGLGKLMESMGMSIRSAA